MTEWARLVGCAALVAVGAFLGLAAARDYLPLLAASAVIEAAAVWVTWKVVRGKPAALRFAGWVVLVVAALFFLQGAVGAVDLAWHR